MHIHTHEHTCHTSHTYATHTPYVSLFCSLYPASSNTIPYTQCRSPSPNCTYTTHTSHHTQTHTHVPACTTCTPMHSHTVGTFLGKSPWLLAAITKSDASNPITLTYILGPPCPHAFLYLDLSPKKLPEGISVKPQSCVPCPDPGG